MNVAHDKVEVRRFLLRHCLLFITQQNWILPRAVLYSSEPSFATV